MTRLAGGLLLIGYGAKAGLVPFHTWLADAHSQAPAPVSALMSGVLLSVAFSVLIRIKPIIDAATGPVFLRTGLLVARAGDPAGRGTDADRDQVTSNGCSPTRRWRTWA